LPILELSKIFYTFEGFPREVEEFLDLGDLERLNFRLLDFLDMKLEFPERLKSP
jgi:hypothetical protein